jgi:hypothetical protein
MITSVLISLALSQAAAEPVPQPQIQVIGPRRSRPICRIIHDTATRIGGYRVCQTPEDLQRELNDNQRDAADAVRQSDDVHWGSIPFSQFALPPGAEIRRDPIQPGGLHGPP